MADDYFLLLEDPRCNGSVVDMFNATVEDLDLLLYSKAQRIFITVFIPLLLIVGLLDNIAFIYVVYHVQRMKTPTNICLINLAIADMLYLVSSLTKRLWQFSQSDNQNDISPIGQIGSILFNFLANTAFFASICFITLVSIERYLKVCKPLKTRGRSKSRQRFFSVLLPLIWILTMCYSATFIPDHLQCDILCVAWPVGVARLNPMWLICRPIENHTYDVYRNFAQCLPFFTTFIIIIILYAVIIRGLSNTVKRSTSKSKKIKMRNQVAWMLIVNGTVFFLLVSPFEVVTLIDGIAAIKGLDPPDGATFILSKISLPLSYLNSAINPFIYIAMSSRYRNAFKTAFSCNMWAFGPAGRYRKQTTMEETINSISTAMTTDTTRESTPLDPVPFQSDPVSSQQIAEVAIASLPVASNHNTF
ncbi:galanin receptor 2a-like [Amphiura filiformis]|uniref:galanin receptor 2a-like n=1 Tax=Amphiura filiformis TaxID=82378 RepID=UPI003B222F9F